jgi:hypothetical protein
MASFVPPFGPINKPSFLESTVTSCENCSTAGTAG